MKQTKFPPGWNEARVQKVLAHYEAQTEEEAVVEDEAAFESTDQTFIEGSNELVARRATRIHTSLDSNVCNRHACKISLVPYLMLPIAVLPKRALLLVPAPQSEERLWFQPFSTTLCG